MINKYLAPVIDGDDAKLPLYVVTVGHYSQGKINRPYGIPHHQILLTTEGSGSLHLDKKKYILSPGSILITPPNTPQKYQPVNKWTTMYITYVTNWSSNYFSLPNDIFYSDNAEKYARLITGMLSLNSESDFCRKSSPILYELLLELHNEITHKTESNDRLSFVHSYIQNHFSEEIDLTDLAGMCGFVPEYFSRIYKRVYHMSPIEHVHKLRMQEAKKKLIFSSLSISQISKAVGYNSPSHFGKLFKQQESLTPNQFRILYKHQ